MTEVSKLMKTNADGTESQVYPETHLDAVVGLDGYIATHGGSGGNQSAEVVAARGKYETLGIREDAQDNAISQKSSKSDLIDLANQIVPGTPKEVFKNVADLKAKYPSGTTGIVVVNAPDGTGHWYYWDSAWKDGGVYMSSMASDGEINRIALHQSSLLNGQDVESISAAMENGTGGLDNFYVVGKAFLPAFLARVGFYTFKPATATIAIFKTSENDVHETKIAKGELVYVKTVEAVVGMNYIDVNMNLKTNYFIGIKCDGISFTTKAGYAVFSSGGFAWETGNTYDINFVKDEDEIAVSVFSFTQRKIGDEEIYATKSVKTMNVIDQTQPNGDPEVYPIIFDFTKMKITISKLLGVINDDNNKSVNYVLLDGTYDFKLPNPINNELPISYELFYDLKNKNIKVLSHQGALNPTSEYVPGRMLLICGFVIMGINDAKTTVSLYSQNANLVRVLSKKATEDKNTVDDVATVRIINSGLYGKTYVAVGDSITAGLDPDNEYKPALGYRYTDIIARETGIKAMNHGTGGATIRNNGENSIFYRISKIPEARCISIMGGTNDYGTGTPLGEYDDGDVGHHFKPAFDQIIQYLIKTRDSQIVIITPINRKEPPATDIGLTLEDYVNVELEVAKKYGIPVLDLYHEYQWHNKYSERYDKFMPDGLHPSKGGYVKMAQQIQNFIVNVMKERI
ncbi:SGNH/GDSL hydrolase family protein [Latilactobacillus sakei]|uniref:SGNH/GDSL hydrolase family protein n=1 Tax=Latilactobacillus sakei TaxID=1599 RepID=UPI003F535D77